MPSSWLHLLLVLRRPTGCEDGGAGGHGWPPQGCSLERLQYGVLGVCGGTLQGVCRQAQRLPVTLGGVPSPPADPPGAFSPPGRDCAWGCRPGAGLAGGPRGQCSVPVLALSSRVGGNLPTACVVGEARGEASPTSAAVGRLTGSALWTAPHPTLPARRTSLWPGS